MFNPSKLKLARERKGISKSKLAEQLCITSKALIDFELGKYAPAPNTLEDISRALGYPIEFFTGDDPPLIPVEEPTFRALTKRTAAERDAVLAAGSFALILNNWIQEQFTLPNLDLPDFSQFLPEVAAQLLREHWGLGELSIPNMIHLLESKGIRVYSLAEDTANIDAFALWHKGEPFVFLNTQKSSERSRFDAAHELGHLVLHRSNIDRPTREIEKEADTFASAFLMPENSVKEYCKWVSSVTNLIELKKHWIVSAKALAYRLKTLELITDWTYRSLFIELPHDQEPEPAPKESSKILEQVFSALRTEGLAKADIAKELHLPLVELEKLIFGLVVKGNDKELRKSFSGRAKGHLKLIQGS